MSVLCAQSDPPNRHMQHLLRNRKHRSLKRIVPPILLLERKPHLQMSLLLLAKAFGRKKQAATQNASSAGTCIQQRIIPKQYLTGKRTDSI